MRLPTPSTSTISFLGKARTTLPLLPLSTPDITAVLAPKGLALAHHHSGQNIFLLYLLARLGGLHRKDNKLPYLGVALFRRAGHLEHAPYLGTGVVCNMHE